MLLIKFIKRILYPVITGLQRYAYLFNLQMVCTEILGDIARRGFGRLGGGIGEVVGLSLEAAISIWELD